MNTFTANRKAIVGLTVALFGAALLAFIIGTVAPDFAKTFSAEASEVVTGQTPAVSIMIEQSKGGVGVLANVP